MVDAFMVWLQQQQSAQARKERSATLSLLSISVLPPKQLDHNRFKDAR